MLKDMIQKIESSIDNLEKRLSSGDKVTLKDVKEVEKRFKNLSSYFNLSEENIKKYQDRIDIIRTNVESNKKKFILIPAAAKEIIASNVKKHPLRTSLVATGIALGLVGCGIAANNEKPQQAIVTEMSTEDNVEPVVINDAMDPEYQQMADEIVASMNDSISKGLVVDEENKEVMAKKYVLYYMLNKMDTLTDEQWANIFQNSTTTSKDIMNAKYDMEWFAEQMVTVSSNGIDYSYMFDENDAKLLNDAHTLFNNYRNATGTTRKEAEQAFVNYINENLALNEGRMNYSQRALDTFRKVYFDAFDTLTEGKVIDDELEHAINTTITCSLAESDLNVEDETIQSLQSKYTTYLDEKLTIRLQTGWNYVALNEVNQKNDLNEIVLYVSNNIDLTLYNEMPDYEDTLTNMLLGEEPQKSKDDSGVSDGQGGNISKEDMEEHGVDPEDPDAKEKYEEEVEEDVREQEEESIEIEDTDGEIVEDPELLKYYAQLGAIDYYAGTYDESKVPEQYRNAYRDGMNAAKAAEEEAKEEYEDDEETTFEEEENEETITEEETETYDYTETETTDSELESEEPAVPKNEDDTITEFVPIEEETEITTDEEIETYEYTEEFETVESTETVTEETDVETYDYIEVSTADYINQLEQLKQELLASTVQITEEQTTKTI